MVSLTLEGAEVRRGGQRLIGPLDLDISGSGITALMGPNGSGKTTLLRLCHGLERASAGAVRWSVPVEEARAQAAFVFQSPVMMRRSVLANIAYPLKLVGARDAADRAMAAARSVGLDGMATRGAHALSGGERQKLAIARAFVRDPTTVFLDEPTASLDGAATAAIEALLAARAARGTRIVIATHAAGQARRLARDIVFLHKGRVFERGDTRTMLSAAVTPEARAYFAGELLP